MNYCTNLDMFKGTLATIFSRPLRRIISATLIAAVSLGCSWFCSGPGAHLDLPQSAADSLFSTLPSQFPPTRVLPETMVRVLGSCFSIGMIMSHVRRCVAGHDSQSQADETFRFCTSRFSCSVALGRAISARLLGTAKVRGLRRLD